MASRVKKIRYYFLVFTFSLLAGSALFLFENFGLMSLQGYVLETPNAEIEKRFWELLPSNCVRYWPVFVYKTSQINAMLERTVPVQVSTEAQGIGLFYTSVSFLEPWLMVEWRGKIWYLSKEGFMWAPELYSIKIPASPLWKVSESLDKYFDSEKHDVPDGVFAAMFSIEELRRYYDILSVQSWYAEAEYIVFDRRAGEFVLKCSLNINEKKVDLLINGEENKLREIDMLLKQILDQKIPDGKELFIDMSYSDKIVVTSEREGSLK